MARKIQYSFERYEKKYFLSPCRMDALLASIGSRITADDYGKYTICNLYYDTEDWQIIQASMDNPFYKEKLRVRSYGIPAEDGTVFVELKKKCAGVVYKRRITTEISMTEPFLMGLQPPARYGQIGQEIAWFQKRYQTEPKVFIAYDRVAFSGTEDPELRITFDTNIRWRDTDLDLRSGDFGKPILPTDQVLMEIKIPAVCPLWLSHLLSELSIFPTSFSKYGTCYRENILKTVFSKCNKEVFVCA